MGAAPAHDGDERPSVRNRAMSQLDAVAIGARAAVVQTASPAAPSESGVQIGTIEVYVEPTPPPLPSSLPPGPAVRPAAPAPARGLARGYGAGFGLRQS